MANLLNVKLQEIHEGKRDYLRYKGRDGRYHFLDTKEMPDSDTNSVTYGQLVEMRQAALLEPGMLYRITDYATTTVQENTRSAGNQFDIVVMALDSKTLAERAWAMPHDGDEYFKNSKLEAWQLWYSLDNDTDRFAWADPENGKGVIYRMIDEHENDAPYDFKNLQFKRFAITELAKGTDDMKAALIYDEDENPVYFGAIDMWGSQNISEATFDEDNFIFAYTFDSVLKDADGNLTHYDMSSRPFRGSDEFIQFMDEDEMGEACEDECYKNVISPYGERENEHSNCFRGLTLPNIVFFGEAFCYFDENEDYWSYRFNRTYGNVLGVCCQCITFGNSCGNNTFGNSCQFNTFGNNCQSNTFGNSCYGNTFGNSCNNNTFGNWFSQNTFGNGCGGNTFGNSCENNTFGNSFEQSRIGDGVNNITVSKDYVKLIIIENGNQNITITSTATTSSSQYVRNIAIALGTNNSNSGKTISHNTTNDTFKTTYQNSNSTTKNV